MTRNKTSRTATVLLSVAVTAAGYGASAPAASASAVRAGAAASAVPPGTTLRVADNDGSLEALLKAAGQDKGFPFKVQYSNFIGGPPMLQAFQAGSVDVGYVATTPEIFAQAAGQSIVAAAAWQTTHSVVGLVNAPGEKITGWASLKGKKVAYQKSTVEESVLLEGLQSVGLTLKDITPVNLLTTSITPALESHSVDAAVLLQPITGSYLAQEPTAKQVALGQAITDRSDFLIAATSAMDNKAKRAAIAYYIGRLVKSEKWVNTHPDQWAKDYYVTDYKVPLAQGEKVVADEGKTTFIQLPGKLEAAQQRLANLFASVGDIPHKVNVASEFSTVFNKVVAADWAG